MDQVLRNQLHVAAEWAANQRVMPLRRTGKMWSLVVAYTNTLLERGTWRRHGTMSRAHMPDLFVVALEEAVPRLVCRLVGYDGLESPERVRRCPTLPPPQIIMMSRKTARLMWSRVLTVAAASPRDLVTDSCIARALYVAGGGDRDALVPNIDEHVSLWCSLMYNADLMHLGSDLAQLVSEDHLRRQDHRIAAKNGRSKPVGHVDMTQSFADWNKEVDAAAAAAAAAEQELGLDKPENQEEGKKRKLDADVLHGTAQLSNNNNNNNNNNNKYRHVFMQWRDDALPLHVSLWRLVRGGIATYLYCAYEISQHNVAAHAIACDADSIDVVAKLAIDASPAQLLSVGAGVRARRFCWPVDASRVQRLYEQTLCLVHDNPRRPAAESHPAELVWRIMTSETVDRNGWEFGRTRVAAALPDIPFAARMAGQVWGVPALLTALHARPAVRPRHMCWLQCTATKSVAPAGQLAADLDMPWQTRALKRLGSDKWVTVQPVDAETRRPTALQVGASIRVVAPAARAGIDFVTVGGTCPQQPFAVVMRQPTWHLLSVGEAARTRCAHQGMRWTPETTEIVIRSLREFPLHGLQALRLLLRLPGTSNKDVIDDDLFVDPPERIIGRLQAVVRIFATNAEALVRVLWQCLDRGAGDSLWTVLETCLCPRATTVYMTMQSTDTAAHVPAWLHNDTAAWHTFFATTPPGSDADVWRRVVDLNRQPPPGNRVVVVHPLPRDIASDLAIERAEAEQATPKGIASDLAVPTNMASDLAVPKNMPSGTPLWAVHGMAMSTQRASLQTPYGASGVLRTADEQMSTTTRGGRLHLDLLDAALAHIASAAPDSAQRRSAIQWLRNVRTSLHAAADGVVRVPSDASPPVTKTTDAAAVHQARRLVRQRRGPARTKTASVTAQRQLQDVSVDVSVFVCVLAAVATTWTGRCSSLERAFQVAGMYLDEVLPAATTNAVSTASVSLGMFPLRPSDVVGTLPECVREAAEDAEEDASFDRASFVTALSQDQANMPRPLMDMVPGAIEGVLANFYCCL